MKPLTPEIIDALSSQIAWERQNHDIYKQVRRYLEALNWPGFAHWFAKRAYSEMGDADEICDYLIKRREAPVYDDVPAPDVPYSENILDYVQSGLAREEATTARLMEIHALVQDDPTALEFILDMLKGQEDDERRFYDAVQEVARAGDDAALLILDHDYRDKE